MADISSRPTDRLHLDFDGQDRWINGPLEGLAEPEWTATQPITVANLPTLRVRAASPATTASTARQKPHATNVNLHIVRAVIALATGTVAARALGVLNQPIISAHFGAGVQMDAYFATLALPVLLTNLVVNALGSSIVPVYVRMYNAGRHSEASEALSSVLNVVLLLVVGLTAVTLLFPQQAVRVMAPGASDATIKAGALLAPYIFPILLLNTVVGFLTSIANATRRFGLPAAGAMLVPIGILLGTVLLGDTMGVRGMALGLLGGTILQFLLMLVITRHLQLHYRPVLRLRLMEVRTALRQFWPMLAGASIGQANPVLDQVIASLLGTGSISALNYALKVMSVPITVVFVAYSQAVYPYFSSQAAARDYASMKSTFRLFAWMIGGVTFAMTLVFVFLASPIVHILFRHGAFTEADAAITAATLAGFAVGLVPMAIEFMLTRTFNALQRNDILLRISIYTLVANVALDILLAHFLGLPGIALATSIDYLLTMLLMLAVLRGLIGRIGLTTPISKTAQHFDTFGATPLRAVRNAILAMVLFAVVAAVTVRDATQGLRLAVGMALAALFLGSPYGLLLTWGGAAAFYSVYVWGHSIGYVLALGSLPAFAVLLAREWRTRREWPVATWAYLAFLLWVVVGIKRSPLSHSQFGIDWLGFLDYGLVFVLAVFLLTTRKRLEQFITVVLMTSTALAALGVAEYALRFGGYQDPSSSLLFRVAGIFGWSNSFAFFLTLVLPLCIYRVLTVTSVQRLLWSGALALHAAALALTFVRTAFIAVIAMVVVAALLAERRWRKPLLVGVAACVGVGALGMLVPGVRVRLLENLTTLNARTSGWHVLLTHLHVKDPLGQGLFASLSVLGRYGLDNVRAPHSLYLQVLFDNGFVGLGLLVVTFVVLLVGMVRRTLRYQGHARILAALATGGLVAGVLYVSVDNTFWVYALGTYFWLLAALPYARVFARRREPATAPPSGYHSAQNGAVPSPYPVESAAGALGSPRSMRP